VGEGSGLSTTVCKERFSDSYLHTPPPSYFPSIMNPYGDETDPAFQFRLHLKDHLDEPAFSRAHCLREIGSLWINDNLSVCLQPGEEILERIEPFDRLFPVERYTTGEKEIRSNSGGTEELLLGHKMNRKTKGEHDKRYICPVLMLGENNRGSMMPNDTFTFYINRVKNAKNQIGKPSGCKVVYVKE